MRPGPVTVFYSYSHKDEDLRNALEAHLAPLRRSGLIREWHDRKVVAGQDWDKQISSFLESADLILFLISADFINSNYIFDVEVKRALERQSSGQVAVVPVILRPVVWNLIPELSRLQALPENARPVTEWPSLDLAFVSICQGIVAVVLARAASAEPGPGPHVPTPRPTTTRGRRRVLDAALPARVPLTKPSTLLVLIRRTDSPGLRAIVEAKPEYDISAKDIDSQPLMLKFPMDKNGTTQPLDLSIRIESPGFEPKAQQKSIKLPPRGDSLPRLFFLTPTQVGPLLVNVEICQGEEMIAGCVLHSVGVGAEAGAEELPHAQSVASAALVMTGDEDEHGPVAATLAAPGEESAAAPAASKTRNSAQHKLNRVRPPRVRIDYDVGASEPTTDLPTQATQAAPPPAPAPQAPGTLSEPPPRPSASYGDASEARQEVRQPLAKRRRSFLSRPLGLTSFLAVLFIAFIGGIVLMQTGSHGDTLSAPLPIAPVLALIALAAVVVILVKLRRR